MKLTKSIFLLTDTYPYGNGELFLDAEIDFLSRKYESIYVYSMAHERNTQRSIPSNVFVLESASSSLFQKFCYFFKAFFSSIVWQDLFTIKTRFHHYPSWIHSKILVRDYIFAQHLAGDIQRLCHAKSIDKNATLFYSYWHDVKALALCFLKEKSSVTIIARGHGWDLDYPRHTPAYLPFKNYMVEHLDQTVSISKYGAKLLKTITEPKWHSKISIARLGTHNHHATLWHKKDSRFLVCSCSSLIPLKRVDFIVRVLKRLSKQIHWIHFGDGPLQLEIDNLASQCGLSYELRGHVDNRAIQLFYAQQHVDLFINVSASEGIPVSIMEAQSAGIPVLALDVGGCSEIVNAENGILLDANASSQAIASAIQDYIKLDAESQVEKRKSAYQNWKENFSAGSNYQAFADLLSQL